MCFICERIQEIKEGLNPYFVKELDTGYVVLGDHQHFKGYTLFLCKQHRFELYELDRKFRLRFLDELVLVAEAVASAFECEKMNYELLGNGESHMHWHLFPRVFGDIGAFGNRGRGPVWWYPREKMYDDSERPSESELISMKEKLLFELNRLLNTNT